VAQSNVGLDQAHLKSEPNTEREFSWRWRASRGLLSPEKDNRAVSESEVKVTLNATATSEPIKKHFTRVFHRADRESRAQCPRFV
jgi:hypothetical protein